MQKKSANVVIDSKHLKILSVKKSQLKDSIVFICLDEEKYGNLDKATVRKIVGEIDKIEGDGVYFPIMKNIDVQMYDKADFKNKDLLITIGDENNAAYDADE